MMVKLNDNSNSTLLKDMKFDIRQNLYGFKHGQKIKLNEQKDIYYMLYFFLQSKLPIEDALELIYKENRCSCILEISRKLKNGEGFPKSLQDAGLVDNFILTCLRIGENSGSYQEALLQIIKYLEQKIADKDYFLKIIIYPAILLTLLTLMINFILYFITPSLYTTFSSMNLLIPWPLKLFYRIYEITYANRFYLFLAGITLSTVAISGIFNTRLKIKIERWVLQNKTISAYLKPFIIRSILWQLHTLMSSGLSLTAAISITKENTNFVYKKILQEAENKALKGYLVSETLNEYPMLFPNAVIKYIKIGETTGYLEENIQNSVNYMEIKCQGLLEKIKQTMQPALVSITGIFVALLVVLILPIINAATSFGGI